MVVSGAEGRQEDSRGSSEPLSGRTILVNKLNPTSIQLNDRESTAVVGGDNVSVLATFT